MSLIDSIHNNQEIEFDEVINLIESDYIFTPTSFKNGQQENNENENNGSCKIFAFAKLNKLTQQQTLNCFGTYYRNDVLSNPKGTDHSNIRNFINSSWNGISFNNFPLVHK